MRPRGLTSQDQLQATGQALGQLIGMDPLQLLSMDFQLGGGRVDPFKSYPGPWQAYTPHLVDHCRFLFQKSILQIVLLPIYPIQHSSYLWREKAKLPNSYKHDIFWITMDIFLPLGLTLYHHPSELNKQTLTTRTDIMHMAVDIPELDQPGGKGLLRSHWFRLAVSEVSTFQVVLLLSAANFVSIKGGVASEMGFQMHQLKHDAITSINAAFRDDDKRLSDSIIGAVAKMASFEAMHGDAVTFALHMEAVCRMVRMRGGLYSLGLAGLLRRMLIWIDLNGGFLLQTPRYFPGQTFGGNEAEVPEPNPARFIAI